MGGPSRRDLLVGAATLAAAACGPDGAGGGVDDEPWDSTDPGDTEEPSPAWCEAIAGTEAEGWVPVRLADHPQLAEVGGAASVRLAPGLVNVVQVEPDCYVAMGTVCTHEGCTVEVRSGARFVCPCHGALYNWEGRPIAGPAFDPLPTFPAAFRDGAVWVKV